MSTEFITKDEPSQSDVGTPQGAEGEIRRDNGHPSPVPHPSLPDAPNALLNDAKPNWAVLGGLRFFLAFIVVVFHLVVMWKPFRGSGLINQFGANSAVCCFLLLSGFSIAHSIKERPDGFLARRFWRIYPVYLTCLCLSLLPLLVWDHEQKTLNGFLLQLPTPWQLFSHVVLLQPLLTRSFYIFNPSWTLGVEWSFYLLAPLFMRLPQRALQILIAVSMGVFTIMSQRVFFSEIGGLIPYAALLWIWLLGFYFVRFPYPYSGFFLMCVPLAILPRFANAPVGDFLWTSTVLLLLLGHKIQLSQRVDRLLLLLGDLSYPLYLIHVCSFTYCYYLFHTTNSYLFLIFAVLCSALVHYGIQVPIKHLKRKTPRI